MNTQQFGSSAKALEVRVNQLFEKNNVSTVRTMQKSTQEDIEQKKQTLRALVGNRYRDLIHSADSIIEMKSTAENVLSGLLAIEENASSLQHIKRSPLEKKQEPKSASSTYAIASEIKELVDTPERIWVALENKNYLDASDMYLEAFARYELLRTENQDAQALLSSIPLLSRQWATISQFPAKIENQSRARLLQYDINAVDITRALYALSQLQSLTIQETFSLFIQSRKESIQSLIKELGGQETKEKEQEWIVLKMKKLAKIIQRTILHTASIFISTEFLTDSERSMLVGEGREEVGQPLFLELLRDSRPLGDALSMKQMKEQCTMWMKEIAELFVDGVRWQENTFLPLQHIRCAEQLVVTEKHVWDQLHKKNDHTKWNIVCSMLLPAEFADLWTSVFYVSFSAHSKLIIETRFDELSLLPLIENEMPGEESEGDLKTNIGTFLWRFEDEETLDTITHKAVGISSRISSLVGIIDAQLGGIMKNLKFLLTESEIPKSLRSSTFASTKHASVVACREHIQIYCFQTLKTALLQVGEKMVKLLKVRSPADVASVQKKILFLSSVSAAIGQHSKLIPEIFPAHVETNIPEGSTFSSSYSYFSLRPKTISNTYHNDIKGISQQQYLKGRMWWSMQQTQELCENLRQALYGEDWTNSSLRKYSWATIEVSTQNEAKKEQIKVPNFPSPFISHFLFYCCEGLHTFSGHAEDTTIICFQAQALVHQVIALYRTFLDSFTSDDIDLKMAREGLVQILFDVRYVFDVLAGAFGSAEEWPENLRDAFLMLPDDVKEIDFTIKTRKVISDFLSSLKKLFEPIDLAFYEPRINANVQVSYLQSTVSLSYFSNTKRLYTQNGQKVHSMDKSNVIAMATPVARFPTLPIGKR